MSTNITQIYEFASVSLTYFASNVTGATWILSQTETPDLLAHQITIQNNSATDHSGKTATIVGTDADGKEQTEIITLPNASATVASDLYFKTITSITPSASIGSDTMNIGYNNAVVSRTIPLDWRMVNNVTTFSFTVTGTLNYTLQDTVYDVQNLNPIDIVWQDTQDAYMNESTSSVIRSYYAPVKAARVVINSYSDGAKLVFNCIGSG